MKVLPNRPPYAYIGSGGASTPNTTFTPVGTLTPFYDPNGMQSGKAIVIPKSGLWRVYLVPVVSGGIGSGPGDVRFIVTKNVADGVDPSSSVLVENWLSLTAADPSPTLPKGLCALTTLAKGDVLRLSFWSTGVGTNTLSATMSAEEVR